MEHYKALLDVVMLLKPHDYSVTEQDARLLFFWSQSVVRDELRNRQRAVSLVYSDFVEARFSFSRLFLPSSRCHRLLLQGVEDRSYPGSYLAKWPF